jgi:hypothetical protein
MGIKKTGVSCLRKPRLSVEEEGIASERKRLSSWMKSIKNYAKAMPKLICRFIKAAR